MHSVYHVFNKITDDKVIEAINLNRSILFEHNLRVILHETGILVYNWYINKKFIKKLYIYNVLINNYNRNVNFKKNKKNWI